MRRTGRLAACLILGLCVATQASANAIDDGNSGLDALNRGDYDGAIALFTKALKSGELKGDDREFAYLNRGKAYLGKHDYRHAQADLTAALKINPSDDDAKDALAQARAQKSGGSGDARVNHGWGIYAQVADHFFWLITPGKDPHTTLVHFDWLTPQSVLHYVVRTKSDKLSAGEYKLDSDTGEIVQAEATPTQVVYGTVAISADGATEYFYSNGSAVRVVVKRDGAAFDEQSQRYADGAWQDVQSFQMVEATDAEIDAAGFKRKQD